MYLVSREKDCLSNSSLENWSLGKAGKLDILGGRKRERMINKRERKRERDLKKMREREREI